MTLFRTRVLSVSLIAMCGALAGCKVSDDELIAAPAPTTEAVDTSINPADDFYRYANNTWLAASSLPDGQQSLDSTSMLRAKNAQRVQEIMADIRTKAASKDVSTPPDVQKIGDFYASQSDVAAIDAAGFAPLTDDLAAIAAINDRTALAKYLGSTIRLDDGSNQATESLWGIWVHQDYHNADQYAVHFVQGGLGLGGRDAYLEEASEGDTQRALYRDHIANVLRLGGLDEVDLRAARVLELEIEIARTQATAEDSGDVFKTDNNWHQADFIANAPGMDWAAYFAAGGLNSSASFVVWQPQSVTGGAELVASQSLDAWKDYLTFHLITHYAAVLPQAIGDEQRAFAAHMSGADAPDTLDPEQQAMDTAQAAFGDAIGRFYVEQYVAPGTKAAAMDMVENIRAAFANRLTQNEWMAAETRDKALAKLAALDVGLAYPDAWKDYSDLSIVRGDAFGNMKRWEAFEYQREVAKVGAPVNLKEWAGGLYPHMVGAILNISPNSMQFTAGILQPPYFDPAGDAAANYGSAGAGISHEISHSFDPVGNLYDAQGRLGLWWTPGDVERFKKAAEPLAAQLDQCCPEPGACGHGKQILSESVADLAGLAVAHDAYLLSLDGKPDTVKNGLTGEQRFFIAFAQRWRKLQTPAASQRQIEKDNHAPPQCRSNLVRNYEPWARAFGVEPGANLYLDPAAQVHVW